MTTQMVLEMLRGHEKDLVSKFLTLCLVHKILAFEKTEQKEPSFTLYERYHNTITFSDEIPTRVVIGERLKKQYPNYQIEEHILAPNKADVWVVFTIFDKMKNIHLFSKDIITVLNPKTFEQVYPELPGNKGKVSPVFDEYLTPINLTAITPEQITAYLRNFKGY